MVTRNFVSVRIQGKGLVQNLFYGLIMDSIVENNQLIIVSDFLIISAFFKQRYVAAIKVQYINCLDIIYFLIRQVWLVQKLFLLPSAIQVNKLVQKNLSKIVIDLSALSTHEIEVHEFSGFT